MKKADLKTQLHEVAQRISTMREIMGISEEEMASKTSVSLEDYRKYEKGESDFSFTFIYKCALRFGIDPTDLIKGVSPTLSSCTVTKKGAGLPIARRHGFQYLNMAPLFKNKIAEPFYVKMPWSKADEESSVKLSSHLGQELDIVIKGKMKVQVGSHVEYLGEGDTIYYNSSTPHGMVAVDGEDCEFYAIILKGENLPEELDRFDKYLKANEQRANKETVADNFINTTLNENGVLSEITFKDDDKFNFGYDVVDAIAEKNPEKLAMLHVSREHEERRFSFLDMKKHSNKVANYFASLGIKKGDRVMLVLKRHYQFWFCMVALHKLGAVAIPATNLLTQHDFEYRFDAAGVKAIVCTGDGTVSDEAFSASFNVKETPILIMANGKKDNWHCMDEEYESFSENFPRTADTSCGNEPILMFFTSGTTGYPKIAEHSHKYGLGHYVTAKYWHNVNPEGLHFTISDTGWGKAVWGKFYGQWLCESAVFTYDFDKFDAHDIMPMFAKYHITTFCAPPTMYRFFIKEDLSKYDLSSIEHSTVAGEALNPEVYEQWKRATGLNLMEGFGQTETTLAVYNPIGTIPKPGSMGVPNPLYDVQIIMPDGTKAPLGETGEIIIRLEKGKPNGLFTGYFRDEEKTKNAYEGGVYHTGDTAWMDEDGYYWYVGRTDDLIKSSGYRIGPFEIESVIMEMPYVLECAVTAAPDPIRGQVVKATIVLTSGTEGTEEIKKEIQNYVKANTAPYKYPRIVEFRDSLPKTISGKIRRVELKD
ncbi:MAG: AMP-binding protein [Clostridia bacterium]